MAPRRPSPAKSLYPNHPSSAVDVNEAPARRVQGETGMNPASRIWQSLQSEYRASKNREPPEWAQSMFKPNVAPRAMKKKR
jgi:hypothetical protein